MVGDKSVEHAELIRCTWGARSCRMMVMEKNIVEMFSSIKITQETIGMSKWTWIASTRQNAAHNRVLLTAQRKFE